ncbi:MAG: hypothetical protein QOH47_573 [Sphingomonadales bacterium]|jgi:hypothetical protein|nr:hypothetical protein [Sphingomonadales bacterium]
MMQGNFRIDAGDRLTCGALKVQQLLQQVPGLVVQSGLS